LNIEAVETGINNKMYTCSYTQVQQWMFPAKYINVPYRFSMRWLYV